MTKFYPCQLPFLILTAFLFTRSVQAQNTGRLNLTSGWGDWIQFRRSLNQGFWGIHNPQSQDNLQFYVTNTNGQQPLFGVLALWPDGKVTVGGGVADSRPDGYKLFVEQGILTERVKVAIKSTSNWSDHVFSPTYKLMPLQQLDLFIARNRHLPNIPSAAEMVEGGLDVAQMDAKLLEKIEELTLYLIQLKKDNEALQQQVTALNNRLDNLQRLSLKAPKK